MKGTKRVLEWGSWKRILGRRPKYVAGVGKNSCAELAFVISPRQDQCVPHPGGSIPVSIYLPWELTVQLGGRRGEGTQASQTQSLKVSGQGWRDHLEVGVLK